MAALSILLSFSAVVAFVFFLAKRSLSKGSRPFTHHTKAGEEYDSWTMEGILEYYWGEHIHLGHYGSPVNHSKDFRQAKVDFVDTMVEWGLTKYHPELAKRLQNPSGPKVRILDVGCGIGGSSRRLARIFPDTAEITGLSISKQQIERATELKNAQKLTNVSFVHGDALDLPFEDHSFDVIWALESEPHIEDKERYVNESLRVLKPGGVYLLASWNVRDTTNKPLDAQEKEELQFLLDEWAHPQFQSIRYYVDMFRAKGLKNVVGDDWSKETKPSWWAGVIEGAKRPWGLLRVPNPRIWWKVVREAYTMMKMDAAFGKGIVQYGMIKGVKPL